MKFSNLKIGAKLIRSAMLGLWLLLLGSSTDVAAQLHPDFSGYVYDTVTNQPIQNASVMAAGNVYVPDYTVYTATTDLNGHFEFYGLNLDYVYTVVVTAFGYESIREGIDVTAVPERNYFLPIPSSGSLVETINEGYKLYQFNGSFNYRTDETIINNPLFFFPDSDAQNPVIDALLTQIGAGTNTTTVPSEIWQKCKITWEWLQLNACSSSYPLCSEALTYMESFDEGWPSINAMAVTYQRYGFLPWGTCVSRAQLYTTLLYRLGVPRDVIAIAGTRYALGDSFHMYPIVYLHDRWLYLDPSFIGLQFPAFEGFASIPLLSGDDTDYGHPFTISILPNATLNHVPEITRRNSNTFNVFIADVPERTNTKEKNVSIAGYTLNHTISQVKVNETTWPVIGGSFQGTVPLITGDNVITAEVVDGNATFRDSIAVQSYLPSLCLHNPIPGCGNSSGNNITIHTRAGLTLGGSNDVQFTWEGTLKTAVAITGQVSNATFSSACSMLGYTWSAHDVAVYGPGTYTIYPNCAPGSPGCGMGAPYSFIVHSGELGVHLLLDWNGANNIDVVNVWTRAAAFGPSPMWTGDCGTNSATLFWDGMSKDWDGDGINGAMMIDGPFAGMSINFNIMGISLCTDAATRCNDYHACTTDSCDQQTGACIYTDVDCYDNNICTIDACSWLIGCMYIPVTCNDNNACTTDTCSTANGCVYTTIDCNDNNACTTDGCAANACTHTAITCNDNNFCTTDACNPATGCVFTPKNCNDNNICTTDSCIPIMPGGCVHAQNTLPCNDNNACTANDTCKSSVCTGTPKNCDDNDSCTIDSCNTAAGNCTRTLAPTPGCGSCAGQPDGTACTDNNACTVGDKCLSGVCKPGPARACNDNNACTADTCDTLNGCVFTSNNSLQCSDGNSCTDGDYCLNGKCITGVLRSCDDNNPCTDDKYVPVIAQCCIHAPNTKPCNDNNACTTSDVCKNSVCAGTAKNCNDYNACTIDTCDPTSGICVHTLVGGGCKCKGKPDGTPCTDNNACTVDACINQVCVSTTPQVCNDTNPCTTDTCDPVIGCVFTPNTLPCSDNNYCTVGDTCSNGICVPGPLMSCDDGNVCTSDVMAPFLIGCCTHAANTLSCNDNNACTLGDVCANRVCVPGTPITCNTGLTCDPSTGMCQQ